MTTTAETFHTKNGITFNQEKNMKSRQAKTSYA
jgi:hypothetical protein